MDGRLTDEYSNKRELPMPKVLKLDEIKRLIDIP